jgi:hypothetical protein
MITLGSDGALAGTLGDARVPVEQIQGAVGGSYQIEARITYEGAECYIVAGRDAWRGRDLNEPASALAGRMIFGTAAILKKGAELP